MSQGYALVNTNFSSWNPHVTTDNVSYPIAAGMLMAAIVAMFSTFSHNWHLRTILNMFIAQEYQETFSGSIHPFFTSGYCGYYASWVVYYGNPLLTMFFALAMVIVAWVEYASKSNGWYDNPKDVIAFTVLLSYLIWMFVICCVQLRDIYNKMRLAMYANSKNSGLAEETARDLIVHLTSIDGQRFRGMTGHTHIDNRLVILVVNCFFFGLSPMIIGLLAALWDRGANVYSNGFIPNFEAGMVGFTGCLLTVIYAVHCLYHLHGLSDYYTENGYDYNVDLGKLKTEQINAIQVGFTADTLGVRMPFKGLFPYQYCPPHYINALLIWGWAAWMCVYNDEKQATIAWFSCDYLPYFLNDVAGGNVYFIAYQIMCRFFFFLVAYLSQGTFYYQNEAWAYNLNPMTVNQSATYPGDAPWTEYGSSIILLDSLALVFTLISFFSVLSTSYLSAPNQTTVILNKEASFRDSIDSRSTRSSSKSMDIYSPAKLGMNADPMIGFGLGPVSVGVNPLAPVGLP